MWIEEKTNSKGMRYKYSERFKDPHTGKLVKVSVTLNSNNSRARNEARRQIQEKFEEKTRHVSPIDEKARALTVHQLADEWQQYSAPMVKLDTQRNHTNYIDRIKKAIPAALLFVELTPQMVEKVAFDMYYREKLSFTYSKCTLMTFKTILRYARKAGYFKTAMQNPDYPYTITDFEEIQLKRRPATPDELKKANNKFIDRDELKSVLLQLRQLHKGIALAMEFIALTGLRCGEMLALREQDYHKDAATINVNGTIVKNLANGHELQRGTPKNEYSYRDVYLSPRAVEIVEWFLMENRRRQWAFSAYRNKEGYIFTGKYGNPYNLQQINRLLRKVELPGKSLSTHFFRHTHISILAESGVPLKAIMQRVGHHNPRTTLAIYTHVTNEMKKACDQAVDNIKIL